MKPGELNLSEFEALVTAIGEYSVGMIGIESLTELSVTLDETGTEAHIQLSLRDNTDAEQKRVLGILINDIEPIYFDEVVLTYSFGSVPLNNNSIPSVMPSYSLA